MARSGWFGHRLRGQKDYRFHLGGPSQLVSDPRRHGSDSPQPTNWDPHLQTVGLSPVSKVRLADIHVVICQVKARVSRARSGERANQQFQDVLGATVCLSASVPALGRTRHPFAVSGSEEPSPKIEFVFSASPETIRREPREGDLLRSVGNMQDLAVCAFCSSCLFRQYFMLP
jgi:hypothetical protein